MTNKPQSKSQQDELKQLITSSEFQDYLYSDPNECVAALQTYIDKEVAEALTALQELVEGCIGEDEPPVPVVPGTHNASKDWEGYRSLERIRNTLRAEIRNNFRSIGLLK